MCPILFKLGPLTIRMYGLLVAVGFFVAMQYLLFRSKQQRIDESRILDLVLYIIIAGLIGARLTYVVLNWSFYVHNPGQVFRIWEGGLVFYGGFFAALAAVYAYQRVHRDFDMLVFADLAAPAVALGHFFGRIGCFFAGCCYGLPTDLPWAVSFSNPQTLAPLRIPLHPTQLYEAAGTLGIFLILDWLNRFKHVSGQVFGAYLFFYGILRFHVEFLRGDDRGSFLWGFSFSQIVAITLVVCAIFIIILRNHDKQNDSSTTA